MFFEPISRVLISQDALWENGFGAVFPDLDGANAFCDVEITLDLIARLNPSLVIPGHSAVFTYSNEILTVARQRLNVFVTNPLKHARHAGKVLVKFKLLELQSSLFSDFKKWASGTPLLKKSQQRFFSGQDLASWFEQACVELVQSGAAKRDGGYIFNA